jgi:hypothetical protein
MHGLIVQKAVLPITKISLNYSIPLIFHYTHNTTFQRPLSSSLGIIHRYFLCSIPEEEGSGL